MQDDSTYRITRGQELVCIGCDQHPVPGTIAQQITPGPAIVCGPCARRAMADDGFRSAIERCAALGMRYRHIERVFVKLGVFDVPVTAAECAEAVGLPEGTVRSAVRQMFEGGAAQ